MATPEEKQELIEAIKGTERYYRILLWGYGGESAYLELDKDTYNYWKNRIEEDDREDDLTEYVLDESRETVIDVPIEFDFLGDPEDCDSSRYPWYDAPTEVIHQNGVDYSSARITIEEVDSADYGAKVIDTIVDGEELSQWMDTMGEEHDYYDGVEMNAPEDDEQPQYVLQIHSSEKGTFFEGTITTIGKFNFKKLKIVSSEYWNGDDTVEQILYDGEDVENNGGDTSGKGFSTYLWEN